MYAAAVAAALPFLQTPLRWAQGTVDYAYQLLRQPRGAAWFRDKFPSWSQFREASLRQVQEAVQYVVVTDISGFYDAIDLATLLSDLRQVDVPAPLVELLATCLYRWANPLTRGIPQGQSASDVLAKVYLNSVDRNLRAMGYVHVRYVDDFRVFCRDRVQAKKALLDLTGLLRQRGLILQAAKSELLRADQARNRIEGVLPTLNNLSKRFDQALSEDKREMSKEKD